MVVVVRKKCGDDVDDGDVKRPATQLSVTNAIIPTQQILSVPCLSIQTSLP